jgi:hypothetical protein
MVYYSQNPELSPKENPPADILVQWGETGFGGSLSLSIISREKKIHRWANIKKDKKMFVTLSPKSKNVRHRIA